MFIFLYCICIEFLYVYFPVLLCLSVSVKWLAVKTASKMTCIVSGGALNSTHSLTRQCYIYTCISSVIAVWCLWCYWLFAMKYSERLVPVTGVLCLVSRLTGCLLWSMPRDYSVKVVGAGLRMRVWKLHFCWWLVMIVHLTTSHSSCSKYLESSLCSCTGIAITVLLYTSSFFLF